MRLSVPSSAETLRDSRRSQFGIATWGVVGVLALLGQASWRLGTRAVEALQMDLTALQLSVLVVWTVFNLYAEGYRAFQKRFSPRVVVRAAHLARNPKPLYVVLAPLYCMALIHATRRTQLVAWSMVVMILGFILLLRQVDQPWRGIIDAGVVAALLWGGVAIIVLHIRALKTGQVPDFPSGLPEGDTAKR